MPTIQLIKTPTVSLKKPASAKTEPSPTPTNAETDSIQELTELQRSFRERSKREQERFMETVDSEYWCCLCFQTRAQKDEFLAKMNLTFLGDKYLDGLAVAKKLNITITNPTPPHASTPFGQETA